MMDDAALDAFIDAGTMALGIEMKPQWRRAVRLHLALSLDRAGDVMEWQPDDHLDPAPVFRA